jgi:hypothetical protein
MEQIFSGYFGFPCHSFNPLIAPQSSPPTIKAWYNRPINASVLMDLVLLHPPQINKKPTKPTNGS